MDSVVGGPISLQGLCLQRRAACPELSMMMSGLERMIQHLIKPRSKDTRGERREAKSSAQWSSIIRQLAAPSPVGIGSRAVQNIRGHRRDRPLCHLYQLIHYRGCFAVPPSFREAIATRAIQKSITESHQAQRASPFRNQHPFCNPLCRLARVVRLQKRFALCLAPRRMRAAFFAYFFLLLKKSKSPKASKATHDAFGPNALEKRAPSVRVVAYQN